MAERLYIEGRRDAYEPEDIAETITVGELIELLREYDEDTPIYLKNDEGYTYGRITAGSIELEIKAED